MSDFKKGPSKVEHEGPSGMLAGDLPRFGNLDQIPDGSQSVTFHPQI
jgi:hypothetical protein